MSPSQKARVTRIAQDAYDAESVALALNTLINGGTLPFEDREEICSYAERMGNYEHRSVRRALRNMRSDWL